MCSKTQNAARSACDDDPRLDAALAERDHLAGLDLAQELGADDVEGARLAGDAVAVADSSSTPERQRAQAVRVAERDDRLLGHHDGRERALQARQHVGDRVLDLLGPDAWRAARR